jgi:hypothetical protein
MPMLRQNPQPELAFRTKVWGLNIRAMRIAVQANIESYLQWWLVWGFRKEGR